MFTSLFINLILNLTTAVVALSLCSGVALHDSRFDKVFATIASAGDTAQHDLGHAVGHEMHVHDLNSAEHTEPGMKARAHRRHVGAHHARFMPSLTTV